MQNRHPIRIRRTFDRRRDMLADRGGGGGWSPLVPSPAHSTSPNMLAASAKTASAHGLRVLVVDNDLRAADGLQLLLLASGYAETRVAYSAHGALAIAKEFCPAIVLIDLDMRDIGGFELGQKLKDRARLHSLRLIAVANTRKPRDGDDARHAGFEGYLLKPVGAAELESCLADRASGVHR